MYARLFGTIENVLGHPGCVGSVRNDWGMQRVSCLIDLVNFITVAARDD